MIGQDELARLLALPAGYKLDFAVAEAMEPSASLPMITAHEARLRQWGNDPKDWVWYSVSYVDSPLGWWQAHIGTDHGPASADPSPVRWFPSTDREPSTDIAAAWLLVEAMAARGIETTVYQSWRGGFGASARMNDHDGRVVASADGPTTQLALCRVALSAAAQIS